MTSEPVRDPLADYLLTPQNCDYTGHTRGQPERPASLNEHLIQEPDLAVASSKLEARLRYGLQRWARSATSTGAGR